MWQPIFMISGYFISLLGFAMLIPAVVDMHEMHSNWSPFLSSAIVVLFIGLSLFLANKVEITKITLRQGYLLTAISWISVALLSSLPFIFYNVTQSFFDAIFEATSGITTTGASIFSEVEKLPSAILLWRSMLNGMGGIGIVIFAVAMLPFLGVGGMQIFQRENSDIGDKFMPKISYIAKRMLILYFVLLVGCILGYCWAGMNSFDAVNHALATISTGGFSTKNNSFVFYNNFNIEFVGMLFMVLGSLPMSFYLLILQKKMDKSLKTAQVITFIKVLALYIIGLSIWLFYNKVYDATDSLRYASFNIISVVTTTGFVSANYVLWGNFVNIVFLIFFLTGGCTGSTSGSIKIFRWQAIVAYLKRTLSQASEPNLVVATKIQNIAIEDDLVSSVLTFMSAYVFCVITLILLVALSGVPMEVAFGSVISSIANVGPGIGDVIGPMGNYSSLSNWVKMILSFAMILGKLDVLTILVILTPQFWRR